MRGQFFGVDAIAGFGRKLGVAPAPPGGGQTLKVTLPRGTVVLKVRLPPRDTLNVALGHAARVAVRACGTLYVAFSAQRGTLNVAFGVGRDTL